jgi:hypothetical protein
MLTPNCPTTVFLLMLSSLPIFGSVLDLDLMALDRQSEFVAIDK